MTMSINKNLLEKNLDYSEVVNKLKEIQNYLYDLMISDYGFEKMDEIKIPGTFHGVTKDSLQLSAHIFEDYLDILIALPVSAREDRFFFNRQLGEQSYLLNQKKFRIRDLSDIQEHLNQILQIVNMGSAILYFNKLYIYPESYPTREEPILGYNTVSYNKGIRRTLDIIADKFQKAFYG